LIEKEQWSNNINNKMSQDNFFDLELYDWFDDCIDKARNKIGLPETIKLPIVSCWANKNSKLQSHHHHSHPNSFLSGIFYLTTHDHSPTIFNIPSVWNQQLQYYKFDQGSVGGYENKIYPKKSTLILFPSHVQHKVSVMKEQETRYTISFNTFLQGEISSNISTKLFLQTRSVRDIIQQK
jgi:uncharacterized protein (TIGR02466 family)